MISAQALIGSAKIIKVSIDDDTLTVDLEGGRTISVPIGWFHVSRMAHPPSARIFRLAAQVLEFIARLGRGYWRRRNAIGKEIYRKHDLV